MDLINGHIIGATADFIAVKASVSIETSVFLELVRLRKGGAFVHDEH